MRKFYAMLMAFVLMAVGGLGTKAATMQVPVKMTYVSGSDADVDVSYGEVTTAYAGYNKISDGAVNLANKGWGVNNVAFLQIDASTVPGPITKVTLSGAFQQISARGLWYGFGYNSSAWSDALTWNTADRSITLIDGPGVTCSKSTADLEASVDVTPAFEGDADKIVTILVYQTAAGGGYIKDATAEVEYTKEDEVIVSYSFSDAEHPVMVPDGSNADRGTCDYTYGNAYITAGERFLNVWGENNPNGFKVATITTEDVTTNGQWTLEFDWAGYSGANGKAGQTKLVDADGNTFFSIDDAAGWGTTFSLSTGQTVACYPCNKATRISPTTGSVFTGDDGVQYWHHFTVIGTVNGVTVTVEQYAQVGDEITKTIVVKNAKASATNVNPSAIGLRPGSCGSVAIANLKLTVGDMKIVTHDYTVNFIDQNGDPVKDSEIRNAVDGEALAATDADKETIIVGKTKYTYVSDDADERVIDEDDMILNITYEKTTVADYTVSFVNGEGIAIKDAVTHKNALVGSTVSATAGEISKMLIDGVFYEYASGNTPLVVSENESENTISLVFAPVAGVTGYFYNNYENRAVDWTTATGGRYDPVVVDGSKIADRATTVRKPVYDPETGELIEYEEVPGLDIPFANKTYFLSVNQANRNNNGVTNGVSSANFAVEQADFTLETQILLGTSNDQGCSFQIKNFAGDANILQLIPTAVGSTTWVVNGDAENFAVELPGTGNFGGTDNNNLTNYDWYYLKVTVYNGTTFVTIVDQNDNVILDKAQVPTLATTYGVGKMIFYTGRYNSNIAVDDVTVRSVVESEDVPAGAEFVAVKINYVDEAGTPVKPADEAKFQVGAPIVLNSAFTADFKVDADGNIWTAESESAPVTKWIYVEDNSADVEAALGAQVNIVFRSVGPRRVALRYQYQTVGGEISTKDASGKNLSFFYDSNKTGDVLFEKDILTVHYPYYLLVDGLLYKTGNNSGDADHISLEIEPGTGTQIKSPVTWTPALEEEEQISNAIFAQESENIEGMTVVKDTYTQIRMANGAAGSAIGGNVLIANLEPGTYTITSATRSGLTNFLAGDEVVFSIESSGTVVTSTSGEFTVDQTTPLYIEEQSGTTKYSDYVLVRQLSSIEGYEITVSDAIEGGTVEAPAVAVEGATVKVNVTPDKGYELASLTITCVESETEINYDINDYSFTMPAEPVFITATFQEKVIYIETDLTSQFLALTDKSTWTSETSSGVGIAEWAAPQVTVAGNKYYMIENYVEGQDKKLATGGVMYNTIKGLTPGLYTIELYGSAALTPGRSDMTTDFEEGDEASLHAVYLYAEAGGNKTQKYIPCLIESNFNNRGGEESIPTATLDNVEVGEDGTIKIGIYKEVGLTNWHIVQLKSVTAKILASDLLEAAVVAAGMIDDDDVPEALYREIQETIATYNKAYDTAEEYLTAVEALKAVVAKAEAYAPLAEAIEAGEGIKENVSEESAIAEYDEAIAPIIRAYEAVAVEDIPAATVRVTAANVTLAKVQDAPNSDLTIVAENSEWINRSGTYAGDCAERWNGSAYEAGKVLYQRIEGLIPNATYEVQFLAVANVAWISAATGEGIAQVFANDAAKDIEVYDQTGCDPTQYKHTLQATADAEGVFEYGLQNVATGGNWYVAKAVALTFKGASYAINYAESMVGGMVSGPVVAFEGDEVALTVAPADGYELASIAVTNQAGEEIEVDYDAWDGIAAFEMPAEAVYVAATFQEAYVKVSEFAIGSDGFIEPDGSTKVTGTYTFETAGSYSDMFFGEVVYDVKITAEGLEEPIEATLNGDELNGLVGGYVPGLVEGTEYTANLVGVHVWDYMSYTEIFTKVAELGGVLATTNFTAVKVYPISYADGMVNGTVEGPAYAAEGDEVELTVTPAEGYELASIAVTNQAGEELEVEYDAWEGTATFEMPEEAVFVAATFQEAYVKVSDFAVASDGIIDEDGVVKVTGTYNLETKGSYSEMFFGEVVYDLTIVTDGAEPFTATLNDDALAGEMSSYVRGFEAGKEYTVYVDSVHVWDYASFSEIYCVKAEEGAHLTSTTFTTQPAIAINLNVERYTGLGYNTTEAEVDFAEAKEFLGVEEITTDMLRVVNPDGTLISDYAQYDGWFDGDGVATTLGGTTKINVKFFEAIPEGTYSICDMNGADIVGTTYTAKWALVANGKQVTYNVDVTFVKAPAVEITVVGQVDAAVEYATTDASYTEKVVALTTDQKGEICETLGLTDISEGTLYGYNPSDEEFIAVFAGYDGWRDKDGDFSMWSGTDEVPACVKYDDGSLYCYNINGCEPQTIYCYWAIVNADMQAVLIKVAFTYIDPTGIDELNADEDVKADGKYIEDGKVVIYKAGIKYNAAGTIAR